MVLNRRAYRRNPKETKELQRQVDELMIKGYIRGSMSSCVVSVLLVPKRMELGGCVSIVSISEFNGHKKDIDIEVREANTDGECID